MKFQLSLIALRVAIGAVASLGLAACSSNKVSSQAPVRTVVVDTGSAARQAPSTPTTSAPAPTSPATVSVPAPVAVPAPPAAQTARPQPSVPASAGYRMPEGVYRCDEGVRITIKQTSADGQQVTINASGKDTSMKFVPVSSGAVRYENAASKITWILTADKGMLFDNRKGQRLANNCKL